MWVSEKSLLLQQAPNLVEKSIFELVLYSSIEGKIISGADQSKSSTTCFKLR